MFLFLAMEVLPEGKNFRLVAESELSDILDFLEKYLPDSLKVNISFLLAQSNQGRHFAHHQCLLCFLNQKPLIFCYRKNVSIFL